MRPITLASAIALVAIGLLGLPATAWAQETLPPDNSAIDEYVENVPGAGGDKPSRDPGGGGGSGDGSGTEGAGSVPPDVVDELTSRGPAGAAAANLAHATAPEQAEGQRKDQAGSEPYAERAGGSGIGEVIGEVTGGSGGMGVALPIILGAALLGGAGLAALRWLRRPEDSGPT